MKSFRLIGTIQQSAIPSQRRSGGPGSGRSPGIFAAIRDRLEQLAPGQALKLRHSFAAPQIVGSRLHNGLTKRYGVRFTARVRGAHVYIWRRD